MSKNPLIETIVNKALKPELEKMAKTVRGIICKVNYAERTVDVVYFEPNSNARRFRYDVPFFDEAVGVIGQSLENGDEVELSFRGASYQRPYISKVYAKGKKSSDLVIEKGRALPRSYDLF